MLSNDILKIAGFDFVNVLLTGETGVGKTHYAQMIHKNSPRADKPFVAINCAAIPADLLESELFGSEKGAFTGAVGTIGKLESANGGTVFLDEIGELSQNLQAKLLTIIEDKKVRRLGSNKEKNLDVRFIFATNRDSAFFRQDFLFRISAYSINIIPLRERREEIKPLILKFLDELNNQHRKDKGKVSFADEIFELCEKLNWLGNIRELKNTVQKLFLEVLILTAQNHSQEKIENQLVTLLTSTSDIATIPEKIPHFRQPRNKVKQNSDINKALLLYRVSKKPVFEICKITGTKRATFYRHLAKAGI